MTRLSLPQRCLLTGLERNLQVLAEGRLVDGDHGDLERLVVRVRSMRGTSFSARLGGGVSLRR